MFSVIFPLKKSRGKFGNIFCSNLWIRAIKSLLQENKQVSKSWLYLSEKSSCFVPFRGPETLEKIICVTIPLLANCFLGETAQLKQICIQIGHLQRKRLTHPPLGFQITDQVPGLIRGHPTFLPFYAASTDIPLGFL